MELEYGLGTPILFKAYPEKEIDKNDTLLWTQIKEPFFSRYWNGKAYKWVFECRVPELSKDSIYKVTAYLELLKPVFITKETIYKPITEYADTIGIAEDSWFDSDSIVKILDPNKYSQYNRFFLERDWSKRYTIDSVKTMWNMRTVGNDGDIVRWIFIDAKSGEILDEIIVSVTEPNTSETYNIVLVPTPSSTSVTILGIENITSVKIVNSLGMEVGLSNSSVVDVSHLASGMYFVNIRTAKGAVVKPMMISH